MKYLFVMQQFINVTLIELIKITLSCDFKHFRLEKYFCGIFKKYFSTKNNCLEITLVIVVKE